MVQWMNLQSFVNRTCLPLLCEKSEAILLILHVVGLMTGKSDKILVVRFENSLQITLLGFYQSLMKV